MVRVAHSIFNAEDLLSTVKDVFNTPSLETCVFYRSFINDTYQLAAAGRIYYLRVYQAGWRTKPEAEAEMNVIEAVYEAGGAVARPVALRDGGFVFDIDAPEASRLAVLFHEARGTELSYGGPNGPDNARRYGRAVGHLHRTTADLGPPSGRRPLDIEAMLEAPRLTVAARLPDQERNYFAELCGRLRERITGARDLKLGFCHGDLNSSNVHFHGDQPTIIDFDCCGWGWLSNDIAAFARGVTLGRLPGAEASALIKSFLQGYQDEKSIAAADMEALPVFLLIQRIWVASLHLNGHHRWGTGLFGPRYAMRLIHWLRSWEIELGHQPNWLESD
jgi:Ser/Thr protein kinase RdoA (MazF antagonist)